MSIQENDMTTGHGRRPSSFGLVVLLSVLIGVSCGKGKDDRIRVTLETEDDVSVSAKGMDNDKWSLVFEDNFSTALSDEKWRVINGAARIENGRLTVRDGFRACSKWNQWSNDNKLILKFKPLEPAINGKIVIKNVPEDVDYSLEVARNGVGNLDIWISKSDYGSSKLGELKNFQPAAGMVVVQLVQLGKDLQAVIGDDKLATENYAPILSGNAVELSFDYGSYELAGIQIYERILPDNTSLIDMGKRYLWKGNARLALSIFNDILNSKAEPSLKISAEYYSAQSHLLDKNYTEAIQRYTAVLDDYPFDEQYYPLAQFERAKACYLSGDLDRAYTEFEIYLKKYDVKQFKYSVYYYLGNIAERNKRYDDALRYYKMFIAENPATTLARDYVRPFFKKYYPDYFKSRGVYVEPDNFNGHEKVSIFYNPTERGVFRNTDKVALFIGVNGWQDVKTIPLVRKPDGLLCVDYAIAPYMKELNFVFWDRDKVWDNNGGLDWFVSGRDTSHSYETVKSTVKEDLVLVQYESSNPNAVFYRQNDINIHYSFDEDQAIRKDRMTKEAGGHTYKIIPKHGSSRLWMEFAVDSVPVSDNNLPRKYECKIQ